VEGGPPKVVDSFHPNEVRTHFAKQNQDLQLQGLLGVQRQGANIKSFEP